MSAAGSRRRLRWLGIALSREEARRLPQVHGTADFRRGDDALHPLHALRSLRPGDRRDHGARHVRTWRARRDRDIRRPHRRFRAVRQHDRSLSGGRADVQAVPLRGADVGAVEAQERLATRRARQQPRRPGEERPRDARAAARERSGERMLAFGQGSLLVRSAQHRRPADVAARQAGRRMEAGRLADGSRVCRERAPGHRCAARSRGSRRAGVAALDARGNDACRSASARARQRQHRLSLAPDRLSRRWRARRHSVPRHVDRRRRRTGPRARRRQLPAQGPAAARAQAASGRKERCADLIVAFGRRRLADAHCASCDRHAVAIAGDARADRRRRRARRWQGRARGAAGIGNCGGRGCHRGQPVVGRAAGDPARQLRDPAPRRVADRGACTSARIDHGRDAWRMHGGGQHGRRLRRGRCPAEKRIERAGDAWCGRRRITPRLPAASC